MYWGVGRQRIHTDRCWMAEISHWQVLEGRDFSLTGVGRQIFHTDRHWKAEISHWQVLEGWDFTLTGIGRQRFHTDRCWKAEISHWQAVEGWDFTLTDVGRLHTDRPTTHTILKRKWVVLWSALQPPSFDQNWSYATICNT